MLAHNRGVVLNPCCPKFLGSRENRRLLRSTENLKFQSFIIRPGPCRIDHTTATLRLISELFSSQSKSANDLITSLKVVGKGTIQ